MLHFALPLTSFSQLAFQWGAQSSPPIAPIIAGAVVGVVAARSLLRGTAPEQSQEQAQEQTPTVYQMVPYSSVSPSADSQIIPQPRVEVHPQLVFMLQQPMLDDIMRQNTAIYATAEQRALADMMRQQNFFLSDRVEEAPVQRPRRAQIQFFSPQDAPVVRPLAVQQHASQAWNIALVLTGATVATLGFATMMSVGSISMIALSATAITLGYVLLLAGIARYCAQRNGNENDNTMDYQAPALIR